MARNLLNTMSAEEKQRVIVWSGWIRRAERQDEKSDRKQTLIKRKGKTKRDHARGVHGNRIENRQARESWQKEKDATIDTFPWQSCNGKRNRRVVTVKGGGHKIIERQRAYGGRK